MADTYEWTFGVKGTQEATGLFKVLQKLDQILTQLVGNQKTIADGFRNLGSAFSAASKQGKQLSDASEKAEKAIKSSANATKELSVISLKNTKNINASSAAIEREAKATKTGSKFKETWFAVMTRAAGIWNTWNKAVDFAAKRLKQLYGVFYEFLGKVQEVGGSFERTRATMEVLAASAGSSQGEIEALADKTKELGRTTEFTSQQAADGAVTLLKAGETASSAYGKLEVALEGALATGLKIDKVAAIGNHAFKIFGDNLGMIGDKSASYETAMQVMIASANAADITVSQLDQELTRGGAILARLGAPLTRVNAALGLFANKGVVGRRAMTHLSIGVKRLVDGTIPATKAMDDLGITAVDNAGNLRDIGQIMQEISEALDLRPANEQVKLMKELFGAADKSMGILVDAGVAGFDKLEEKIFGALETMTQLKKARADTMVGSLKEFQSAAEGVYVELVDVLSLPIQEFWGALANILNLVSDRIMTVGKTLQDTGGGLSGWVDAIKGGAFEGIFEGLADDIQPELEKLSQLAKGAFDLIKQLFIELWDEAYPAIQAWFVTTFPQGLQPELEKIGEKLGESLVQGMVTALTKGGGVAPGLAKGFFKNWVSVYKGVAKGGLDLVKGAATKIGIGGGGEEGGEAIAIETPEISSDVGKDIVESVADSIEDNSEVVTESLDDVLKNWQPKYRLDEFDTEGEQTAKDRLEEYMTANPTLTEAQAKKDLELQDYVKEAKAFDAEAQAKAREGTGLKGQTEQQLKDKQAILAKQEELINAEKRQKEAIEKTTSVMHDMQLEINNAGAEFEKWLLNPIDVFQQKILGIKEGFGSMVDSLRSKQVDVLEKFGLKSSDEANQQRMGNMQKSMERDKELLKLAQTPEEQAKIQERLAGKAEELAGMTEGQEQQEFAKKAADYLAQAEESAMKGEELRMKEVEISRQNAEKNLAEYEALVKESQTAGSRAGYLEQLKEAYMQLGPEYRDKAVQAQEEWKKARADAAAEEAEYFKRTAEASELQVELLTRAVEALEQQQRDTQEAMNIGIEEEYSGTSTE